MIDFATHWILATLLSWLLVCISHRFFPKQTNYTETEFSVICFLCLFPFVNLVILLISSVCVLSLSFYAMFKKIYWRLK